MRGTSCDDSTRGKVLEKRDATRGELITKGLDEHPRCARTGPRDMSGPGCNETSCLLPGFRPSPAPISPTPEVSSARQRPFAFANQMGQVERGRDVVDLYREAVLSASTVAGDHYRKRHNALKMRLHQMCQWAWLEAKIFNLFSASKAPRRGWRGRRAENVS